MGLRDWVAGQFIDIIEWTEPSQNEILAYRFPRHNNEIKNGAKLVVREGQAAVCKDVGLPEIITLRGQARRLAEQSAGGCFKRVKKRPGPVDEAAFSRDYATGSSKAAGGVVHSVLCHRQRPVGIPTVDGLGRVSVRPGTTGRTAGGPPSMR